MFSRSTPEKAGIGSEKIAEFIRLLEKRGLNTHGILMLRGNSVFHESYWAPFKKDDLHRMYSQTKSFVGVAIGLLIEEGKLSLNDKIISYFPEKIDRELPEYIKKQTIRDMLTMCTYGSQEWWFRSDERDRTRLYFSRYTVLQPSGTLYRYDSGGSQVLCALVEKLTGKKLLDYLREKIFNFTGYFKKAYIIELENGDSWGDSAMLCTLEDMASFGRFVMNYGTWNGTRLMNEEYLREATKRQVSNNLEGFDTALRYGYGYQIWRTEQDGFAFIGMGDQLTVCIPEKDFIFTCVSDNQGYAAATEIIINALFDIVVDNLSGEKPENIEAQAELNTLSQALKLKTVRGEKTVPFIKEIDGVTYICEPNKMGIKEFSLLFNGDEGIFRYINEQGEKKLKFGLGKNVFTKFPQLGYSGRENQKHTVDGFTYDCAVSAAWVEEKKLMLRVQIIDCYLGNMTAVFGFKNNVAAVNMIKNAEAFLDEYSGFLIGKRK